MGDRTFGDDLPPGSPRRSGVRFRRVPSLGRLARLALRLESAKYVYLTTRKLAPDSGTLGALRAAWEVIRS